MAVGNPLMDLFGQSPVRPIQEHMQKVQACTAVLSQFLVAAQKGDWKKAEKLRKDMVGLKKLADRLKLSVRTHVPKRLFMPVSRTDLLELVTAQDRIAMCSKDIAGLMLGRKMSFPKKMDTEVKEYLAACIEVSDQAMKAIDTLDEVFEAGFGRREVAKVDSMIKQIGKSEKKTDKLQIKVRALLFSMEESLPPVEVMFLYMILGLIGDIADYAERTGNRLQILISL